MLWDQSEPVSGGSCIFHLSHLVLELDFNTIDFEEQI